MDNNFSRGKITRLKKRWIVSTALANCLIAAGTSILISAVLHRMIESSSGLALLLFPIVLAVLCYLYPFWKFTEQDVSGLLNRTYPELEESSQLLLRESAGLNRLEKLQQAKIGQQLARLKAPKQITVVLFRAGWIFLATALLGLGVGSLPARNEQAPFTKNGPSKNPIVDERDLAEIRSAAITIHPPTYTRQRSRKQEQLNLKAEEGSNAIWVVETNYPVKTLRMILNNKSTIPFAPLNTRRTRWYLAREVRSTGFYQLDLDHKRSDLYQIEVIKDLAPAVKVESPQPYTVVDFGQPQRVQVQASATDDYGLSSITLVATTASGRGEAVAFKEHRLPLSGFIVGQKKSVLQRLLDLPALGMRPGDELYFYLSVVDNRHQESRSDIYTVAIADTAQLLSMEGLSSGVNLVPEYFRSQRQIIIDTERLLKEQDSVTAADFKDRSNNLGVDQKLLRLRYGKFLGEESESEVGESDGHDEAGGHQFGDAQSMMDAVSHKHDNSEDASFFEPEQKAQLKAVLAEMWKAELQLRTFKPQAALPFEYKALRLLKDLQQKSRAYVGKTAVKTTPLKPEKRLTGELEAVTTPKRQRTSKPAADPGTVLRAAMSALEDLKHRGKTAGWPGVSEAAALVNERAAAQPAQYLPALRSLQRILAQASRPHQINLSDIQTVEAAFQRMVKAPAQTPARSGIAAGASLSETYFRQLNKKN